MLGLIIARIVVRLTRRLAKLIIVIGFPFAPTLAQDFSQIHTPSLNIPSASELQLNSPPHLRPTSYPVSLSPVSYIQLVPFFPYPSTFAPGDLISEDALLLLPKESCFFPSQVGLLSACLTLPPPEFPFPGTEYNFNSTSLIRPTLRSVEKMHWKAAFWQSFGFLVAGHAFRLANDDGARYLLIHKPFWHDYWASADNFHMSRWGDGDDFLVNYIGHPMEGAVYGDIFINNDPKGRTARFGKSSNYWYSRLRAMAWATVWEAYFEIGPVLSEAAIGNEGGYTYYPGCGRSPCAKEQKPATNNTGWVDFVITPVVGLGWIVMEDAIEREFVDRLANGSPALKYKMLRGSLAPSHTFANLFAGKTPWFRYAPESSFTQSFGGPLQAYERPAWKDESRFSLGAQFISMSFPSNSASCADCRKFIPGYGFDFTYRFAKYAYFDSVVNLLP